MTVNLSYIGNTEDTFVHRSIDSAPLKLNTRFEKPCKGDNLTTPPNSADLGFSRRQDVLNKTLLRSIKKYITSEFNEMTNFENLEFKEKQDKFKDLLEKYFNNTYQGK